MAELEKEISSAETMVNERLIMLNEFTPSGNFREDATRLINLVESKTIYESEKDVLNNDLRIWLNQYQKYYGTFVDVENADLAARHPAGAEAPRILELVDTINGEDTGEQDVTPEDMSLQLEQEVNAVTAGWDEVMHKLDLVGDHMNDLKARLTHVTAGPTLQAYGRLEEMVNVRCGFHAEQVALIKKQCQDILELAQSPDHKRTKEEFEYVIMLLSSGNEKAIVQAEDAISTINDALDKFDVTLRSEEISLSN